MNIAVASGKGGTGKTTVAVNIALTMARRGVTTVFADCDVEEPNGHIFLKPDIRETNPSRMMYPVIDAERCIGCGKCAGICEFNAIAIMGNEPMVFPELCHACGGCVYVCPVDAVGEGTREIGTVSSGSRGDLLFVQGSLDIGQVLSPPLIRDVKRAIPPAEHVIIDCPPGTSCPVVTAVTGADFALLVTEPTPFGLHDLKLAVDAVDAVGIPAGAVINRYDLGASETESFLRRKGVPLVGVIPDDDNIARAYSEGEILIETLKQYEDTFGGMMDTIIRLAARP